MKIAAVQHVPSGTLLGDRIAVADTSLTRLFGLVLHRGLDAGEGLWIRPSSGIHTFAMTFTIDALGLDRDLRIVKLWPRMRPWRVSSIDFRVKSVLELAAGEIEALSLTLGDTVQILR